MQHSAIRSLSEQVTLFAKTDSSNSECLLWSLLNDGSFSQIQYTPNIQQVDDNLYSTDVTLPDYDCTVFALFKEQPIVISVGNPEKFFIYYRVNEGESIPYEHITDSGATISSGILDELTNGFYSHKVEGYDKSIIIVDNRPFPVRIPYNTGNVDCSTSGNIKIENNVWQLISIPVKDVKVKEYFVDSSEAISQELQTLLLQITFLLFMMILGTWR